jgi:hypothetical protein
MVIFKKNPKEAFVGFLLALCFIARLQKFTTKKNIAHIKGMSLK